MNEENSKHVLSNEIHAKDILHLFFMKFKTLKWKILVLIPSYYYLLQICGFNKELNHLLKVLKTIAKKGSVLKDLIAVIPAFGSFNPVIFKFLKWRFSWIYTF